MDKLQPDILMKRANMERLEQEHSNRRARNLLIAKTVGFVLILLVASLVAVYVML